MDNRIMNVKEQEYQKYLKQKQKFFDLADNIKDEKLKNNIVYQMLKLENILKNNSGGRKDQ